MPQGSHAGRHGARDSDNWRDRSGRGGNGGKKKNGDNGKRTHVNKFASESQAAKKQAALERNGGSLFTPEERERAKYGRDLGRSIFEF